MVAFLCLVWNCIFLNFIFIRFFLGVGLKFMCTLLTIFRSSFVFLYSHVVQAFCSSHSQQLYVCISLHYLTPMCSALAHERERADEMNKRCWRRPLSYLMWNGVGTWL